MNSFNNDIIENTNIIVQINNLTTNLEYIEQSIKQSSEKQYTTNVQDTQIVNVFDSINATANEITIYPILTNSVFDSSTGITMINLADHPNRIITEIDLILLFLKDKIKIISLLDKLNYIVDNKILRNFNNILDFLATNNVKYDNYPPVKNIIDGIKQIFIDGQLNSYDIPTLINIITNLLNVNLTNVKLYIDTYTICIIIKVLIHVLLTEKIIIITKDDESTINKMIDSSISLLDTTIQISNIKCSCLPCFRK